MSNITLRTGNSFLISTEFDKWKTEFINKYWAENIFSYNNPEENIDEILSTILGWGLFSNKKMVIIHNIPRSSDTPKSASEKISKLWEYIIKNYKNLSDDSVICLISPKPDWRTKIYKDISSIKEITKKDYQYSDSQATNIIKLNCPNISQDAINQLI